jgi:hypothetical protein
MPALIARHLHRLPPTSTRLSRRVDRVARHILSAIKVMVATLCLGLACVLIGAASQF